MATATVRVGPADNGRRMDLDEFDEAEGQEGYLYELGRGIVIVTGIPDIPHFRQVNSIRQQLSRYEESHPGLIRFMGGGSECKILLEDLNSERHPDWSIYLTEPPAEKDAWSVWIPELVIEVVSPGSAHRDYVEKREEYLQFGIREYWIIDADQRQMLVLRRSRGRWAERVVRPGQIYETSLLPGLKFDCGTVLEAARRRTES